MKNCNSVVVFLCIGCLIGSSASGDEWAPVGDRIKTRWAADVNPENVHAEYPRPQMARDQWTSLNGLWQYAITDRVDDPPASWDGDILVPFCVESSLSGVGRRVSPEQNLWYRRTFTTPPGEGERVLLNFGAVDWEAVVWVNGERAGEHRGGYDPFTLDITDLVETGENELIIQVWDPTDAGHQPRGKQVLRPHRIWYTPVTGIWQTVWLERVPNTHIQSLVLTPQVDDPAIHVAVHASTESDVHVRVSLEGDAVAEATGTTGRAIQVAIPGGRLWSPDSPTLYDLSVELRDDEQVVDTVNSYFGLREVSVAKDQAGVNRIFLNGEPLFQYGPLDQGWWPDGLYTAASDAALRYDVEVTKQLGFNMTRKHVKVEPARWYYWCDKLGLLVWQDMPSGDAHPEWIRDVDRRGIEIRRTAESADNFRHELTEIVTDFYNHPSIVVWVPFNERWGQSNTAEHTAWLRHLDPTRLVNSASGGSFMGVGDILDVHNYPDPVMPRTDPHMAVVCGEFGGLGLPVEGHTWLDKGNWGYRSYENPAELATAYREKINMLRPLIERGLAAAIYTQITDVEIEVNGLLTYDREEIKVNPDEFARTNRSLYELPNGKDEASPPAGN
jgi:beta-galactosidase/beta-glucuronidase